MNSRADDLGEVHYVDFIMEQSDKDSGNLENKQTYTYTGEGKKERKREKRQKGKEKKFSPLMKLLSHSFH